MWAPFLCRYGPIAFAKAIYYLSSMPARTKIGIGLCFLLLLPLLVSSQAIYKTPSGKKYHLGTCHMVKNVSEKITPAQAIELGLGPCHICRPDINHLQPSTENKATGQSTGVQCRGITKRGTRCRHFTHIANGYCFQHQPK